MSEKRRKSHGGGGQVERFVGEVSGVSKPHRTELQDKTDMNATERTRTEELHRTTCGLALQRFHPWAWWNNTVRRHRAT